MYAALDTAMANTWLLRIPLRKANKKTGGMQSIPPVGIGYLSITILDLPALKLDHSGSSTESMT